MTAQCSGLICFAVMLVSCTVGAWGAQNTGRVLWRQSLPEDQELVVTQGEKIPISALHGLISADVARRVAGFCSWSVEIRLPNKQAIVLASSLIPFELDSDYDRFDVLDGMILPNRIILVNVGARSDIGITDLTLYGGNRFTTLPPFQWSLLAAAIATPPKRLTAKVSYDAKNDRLQVEITDHMQDTKQHTVFQQKKNAWEFVRVKQWQEQVPQGK